MERNNWHFDKKIIISKAFWINESLNNSTHHCILFFHSKFAFNNSVDGIEQFHVHKLIHQIENLKREQAHFCLICRNLQIYVLVIHYKLKHML